MISLISNLGNSKSADYITISTMEDLVESNHYDYMFSTGNKRSSVVRLKEAQQRSYYYKVSYRHRGSYISADVSLNLLNELGKRDKMRSLPSILSLFRNEFNKFNNTGARMLDSIYHMTMKLF